MLNLIVDTYKGVFKYDLNEFLEPDKIKWLASVLEGSLKDLMESILKENKEKYLNFKKYISEYLSNSENYEEDREEWLKWKMQKRAFLQIKGKMYDHQIAYDYSEIEDLAIALMLIFANIYNQLFKVDKIKANNFKQWSLEEVGNGNGSLMWHTLEFCILD